ncbi:hypothetical protein OG936_22390 [Streptomyces sp. NBC_00846]|uniref:hypothetical protein n=1 Tax=Streptomyces sp. NBC_00846 TaxID=2975849 RepID=UPI00386B9040|nr:hypothetical protein OG936_22390 [Streptomyces sp. NBC_00846]
MDWQTWHDQYDVPDSWLSRRPRAVSARIRAALDAAPPGPLRVISVCAGQAGHGVGAHRFTGEPHRLAEEKRMFDFVGYDVLEARAQAKPGSS